MGGNFLAGEWARRRDGARGLRVLAEVARGGRPAAAAPAAAAIVGLTFDAPVRVAGVRLDGRRQGGVRVDRALPRARPRARTASGSTWSRPARSARPPRSRSPGFEAMEGGWPDRAPLGWDVNDPEPTARAVAALLSGLVPRRRRGRSCTSTAACTRWDSRRMSPTSDRTRRLVLLRHAKAEQRGGVHRRRGPAARPARARRQSGRVGRSLLDDGLVPELALVSPSVRTRQTWELLRGAFGDARPEVLLRGRAVRRRRGGARRAGARDGRARAVGARRRARADHLGGGRRALAGPDSDPAAVARVRVGRTDGHLRRARARRALGHPRRAAARGCGRSSRRGLTAAGRGATARGQACPANGPVRRRR